MMMMMMMMMMMTTVCHLDVVVGLYSEDPNDLEVRSQLRADHMVRTTTLHVTSAKWLVNLQLQRRLRL